MTTTGSLPAPILQARPHEDVVPHCYVVVRHHQVCTCCGHTATWSELYARTFYRSVHGMSKAPVNNLRRVDWPKYNLPITRVEGPTEKLPFCDGCWTHSSGPSLAHNYDMLEPPSTDMGQVLGMSRQAASAASKAPAAKAPKTKTTATLDSLSDF